MTYYVPANSENLAEVVIGARELAEGDVAAVMEVALPILGHS